MTIFSMEQSPFQNNLNNDFETKKKKKILKQLFENPKYFDGGCKVLEVVFSYGYVFLGHISWRPGSKGGVS